MNEHAVSLRVLQKSVKPYAEMACELCGGKTKVVDSRGSRGGVRRRRECLTCLTRFTTYEGRLKEVDTEVVAGETIKRIIALLRATGAI